MHSLKYKNFSGNENFFQLGICFIALKGTLKFYFNRCLQKKIVENCFLSCGCSGKKITEASFTSVR